MPDTIYARMRQLVGTTPEWAANDRVIGNGEIAVEITAPNKHKFKVGDGFKRYSQLGYLFGGGGGTGDDEVVVGDSPPASPTNDMLWWSSALGKLFVWYDDGNTRQWVETGPGGTPQVGRLYVAGIKTPEMFGAVGDGAANDTAALSTCLNSGGTVLMSGRYRVTATVTVTGAVKIIGYGGYLEHDTTSLTPALEAVNVVGFEVYGLEVNGRRDLKLGSLNAADPTYGIAMAECERVIIQDCYVHDCFEHGIRVGIERPPAVAPYDESLYIKIIGNHCQNNGREVVNPDPENPTFTHRGQGIWCYGLVRNLVIANNTCVENGVGGIGIDDHHSLTDLNNWQHTVTGNVVVGPPDVTWPSSGIGVSGTTRIAITGNIAVDYQKGISLTSVQANERMGNGVISGNYCAGTYHGITLVDVTYVNVSGNTVIGGSDPIDANAASIALYSNAGPEMHNVSILGNHVFSYSSGIRLDGSTVTREISHEITIGGNRIASLVDPPLAGHYGIYVATYHAEVSTDTNVVLRGNDILGFYDGIRSDASSVTWEANIIGNHVKNSLNYGIHVGSANKHSITGNVVQGSGAADLAMHPLANAPTTLVVGNIFKSATVFAAPYPLCTFSGNYPTSINNGITKTGVYTVATLPAPATVGEGARAMVTDATAPAFGATVVGGGAGHVPVFVGGANWVVG